MKNVVIMMLILTIAFIVLDMITGIVKAFKEKNFTSTIMREGLFHKSGELILLVFGFLVDFAQKYIDLGVSLPMTGIICVYICLMEIGSIIENVGKINPSLVPANLQQYFFKLKKED